MMDAYLFVHFVGTESAPEHEQVYFSVSRDGRKWDILNSARQVLTSNVGEYGARDPFVIRSPKGDKFYIIATDLSICNRRKSSDERTAWAQCKNMRENNPNPGSKKMLIWESNDLVNWSDARLVELAPEDAGCFWAPKCIWDKEKNSYMVFGASCTSEDDYKYLRLYRSYTKDFVEFTKPKLYIDKSSQGTNAFDAVIVEDGEKYYRIYKTDRITMESALSLSGEWSEVNNNIYTIAPIHEGPAACRINGTDMWMMMLDNLKTHGGYQAFTTGDLSSGLFKGSEDIEFPVDVKYRHGSILPITQAEYDRLIEKYRTRK